MCRRLGRCGSNDGCSVAHRGSRYDRSEEWIYDLRSIDCSIAQWSDVDALDDDGPPSPVPFRWCGLRLYGEEYVASVPCRADGCAGDIRPDHVRGRNNGLAAYNDIISSLFFGA